MTVLWLNLLIFALCNVDLTCVRSIGLSSTTVLNCGARNLNFDCDQPHCSTYGPKYADNSARALCVYELRSLLNGSVVLACTGNKRKLEHFSRHIFGHQHTLQSSQIYHAETNISTTDVEGYKRRYGSLWRTGRFLTQSRGFLEALRVGDTDSDGNRKGKQTFDQVLQSGIARIKMFASQSNTSMGVTTQYLSRHLHISNISSNNNNISSHESRFNSARTTQESVVQLKRLALWFREHFPYYYSQCIICCGRKDGGEYLGCVHSSPEECAFLSKRTELYFCKNDSCAEVTRFPRYNDICKVLETRRGRCGEYSTLMMTFLESLGYTARYIVDRDDHVWAEVLLNKEWIHIDPCEAVVDEPLLYESWGKNQTFNLSFQLNADNETGTIIEDVTSRYTSNYRAVMERRIEEGVDNSYVEKKIDKLIDGVLE